MSKAGIQSNRGDGYQTLVAFDWALTVISNPDYLWLEIDSVSWPVDDVVIGKADGSLICCQCKKNQPEHRDWSVGDLADELRKAIRLLSNNPNAEVCFYSRTAFGEHSRLREYSLNYADKNSYQANLGKVLQETDKKLLKLLEEQKSDLSTYQFLQHTKFGGGQDLDQMQLLILERLRNLVSNPSAAFNAVWTQLDHLGFRASADEQSAAPKHRLTKEDLKDTLKNAGSLLTRPMEIREIRAVFNKTSAIGRSWRRDIGNEQISSPAVKQLIEDIEAKTSSILLTGTPGSGKTCVMLCLQEQLERLAQNRNDLIPLFIQSREFADFAFSQDREAQGLSNNWVEIVGRAADDAHVVVIIDSLDVLSIAREQSILTYFLAQIERLLRIPNVTVVTACREFDLQYDRRIANCDWNKKIICQPLNWDTEITPLLEKLDIDSSTIDATTREIISNPRKLALYVDLAKQGGSLSVINSQKLELDYLEKFIQQDRALGDSAMQAIEKMAEVMLQRRSLEIPYQQFSASEDIKRALLSNKVLCETQTKQLTFGHQTLLDVLVINRAIRQAMTLNTFIQNLPPVPFVRPSIRSFVEQLAIGDQPEFRKQLRTVLTGNAPFHIRRLVAETLAELKPSPDYWSLIRDLRTQNPEIFQAIYLQARHIEWHYFWTEFLVPTLKETQNTDALERHVIQISRWKNEDAHGVCTFWTEMLALNGMNKPWVADSISIAFAKVNDETLTVYKPLIQNLLKLPRPGHSFLGRALVRCVSNGLINDEALWTYIVGEITENDVHGYHFDNKLHCQPHEFGDNHDTFLANRMQVSAPLLDLAIESIKRWGQLKACRFGGTFSDYFNGFLIATSYSDTHSKSERYHSGKEKILLRAIESAILYHAKNQSSWWQNNREHLCFSSEVALRYCAILACTEMPTANIEIIGRMLCDKNLLESNLSFELGSLLNTAFLYLDSATQDTVQTVVLTLYDKYSDDADKLSWIFQARAQFILSIPCHFRIPQAQVILCDSEREKWPVIREPKIGTMADRESEQFTFKIFLITSDEGVLNLLNHYSGYERQSLMGGERIVAVLLSEAASRQPTRYMYFLSSFWKQIAEYSRESIIQGVANYLAYNGGQWQPSHSWAPDEKPDAVALTQQILNELEGHLDYWSHHHSTGVEVLNKCAYAVRTTEDATRLISLLTNFSSLQETISILDDTADLLSTGFGISKGKAAQTLMILANQLSENRIVWPNSLPGVLCLSAANEHPAIRALMLNRMPYLQSHHPEFGWELFGLAMKKNAPGLWKMAKPCLYHAYHHTFETVAPWLARIFRDGSGEELEVWGCISALAAISKKVDSTIFIKELYILDSADAWEGASDVWTYIDNLIEHKELCLSGLEAGLKAENQHATVVAQKCRNIFHAKSSRTEIPIDLIRRCLHLLEIDSEPREKGIYGFEAWLNASAQRDPIYAIEAAEIYIDYVRSANPYSINHEKHLTQLLTQLFSHAEELEESDGGEMLQRVVKLQDKLLALGIESVNDWLKDAESR